jgi:PEGA domain-containing protein
MTPWTIDNPRMDARPQRTRTPRLAALALALCTPGCVLFQHPKGISVSSTPPGATVLIAQRDTGYVTPCVIDIDPDDDERVDIVLPGYVPETRYISPDHEVYAILWREMSVGFDTWDFPLFVNFRDFFVPIKVSSRVNPARIHVTLDRAADHVAPESR